MSNIHKEISQLEHWLITLPEENTPKGEPSLLAAIDKLTKQMEVQQHVMNHIVDRLDVLERGNAPTMPSQDYMDDPWLDHSGTTLQNEIIDVLEPVYCIRKADITEDPVVVEAPKPAVETPVVETPKKVIEVHVPVVEVAAPVVEAPKPVVEAPKAVEAPTPVVEAPKPVVAPKPTTLPIVTRPPVTLPVIPVVKQQEPPQEEQEEEVEEEEEAEEEQEEEEESYEMVTYQGTSYCKDSDGLVYSLNEEGEPSDNAVGIWKEKTQSIRFYRTT